VHQIPFDKWIDRSLYWSGFDDHRGRRWLDHCPANRRQYKLKGMRYRIHFFIAFDPHNSNVFVYINRMN